MSGRIEIDTLNEKFDLELPESDDYVTIAGFILHFYQKFPKLNETIVIDKYSFKIVKSDSYENRISSYESSELIKKKA